MEVYSVDFFELEKNPPSSEELLKLANRMHKEADLISATTDKGLGYYSAARLYRMSGGSSSSLDHRREMGECAIRLFELGEDNGHLKSICSLSLMFKDGQSLCDPNPEKFELCKKRKSKWEKEIWDFYVSNLIDLLEQKGFVFYGVASNSLHSGFVRTHYGVARMEFGKGSLPFSLKFNGTRKDCDISEMSDVDIIELLSQKLLAHSEKVSNVVLDNFLGNHFRNINERWPDRKQIQQRVNNFFDEVVFPFFFEWEQKELGSKIVKLRRKLGHKV